MAFATLEDVKRVLRLTDANAVRDAQLRASLDAVESWAATRLWRIGGAGSNVETYWDVHEDATLQLPADDVTVTVVKVYEYPSANSLPLSPIELGLGRGYDITDNGRLILRPTMATSPFEGATAQRPMRTYSRVEVYYQGTGQVPRAVTEGIAFLAAGYWTDGPRALRGITSERIGDYSYTVGQSSDEAGMAGFIARAYWYLAPYLKKGRVTVT